MVLLVEAGWPVFVHRPVSPILFCRWAATGARLASAVQAHFRKAKRARTDRDMIAAEDPPPEPLMSAHTKSTATVPGRGADGLCARQRRREHDASHGRGEHPQKRSQERTADRHGLGWGARGRRGGRHQECFGW